jgi:hypothetical protein
MMSNRSPGRIARPKAYCQVIHRAARPLHVDRNAPIYEVNQWIQQEIREPRTRCGPLFFCITTFAGYTKRCELLRRWKLVLRITFGASKNCSR